MTPLFRPEALDGQRRSWLGAILLIRPLPLTLLTLFTAGVAAAVIGFLFVGEYTRKAHLSGVLVPDRGLVQLVPPQSGTVLESHVREGQAVRQGDVLFVLSVDRAALGGDTRAPVQQSLASAQRNVAAVARESPRNEPIQRIVIRAPQDGVLAALLAEPGQSVSPPAALASLVPAQARLQAQLYAPPSAIGWLQPQQRVQLRYEAFPYQTFGHYPGQVLQVSRTPLRAGELSALSLSTAATGVGMGAPSRGLGAGESLYRVTVVLDQQVVSADGQAQPLAAGMRLDADVLLERRRLIEWLFEPVLGRSGRV